jgi:hypothetical protein
MEGSQHYQATSPVRIAVPDTDPTLASAQSCLTAANDDLESTAPYPPRHVLLRKSASISTIASGGIGRWPGGGEYCFLFLSFAAAFGSIGRHPVCKFPNPFHELRSPLRSQGPISFTGAVPACATLQADLVCNCLSSGRSGRARTATGKRKVILFAREPYKPQHHLKQ